MALAERTRRAEPKGAVKPRIAPPTPARSDLDGYRAVAGQIGIDLMPWQETAARYITARGQGEKWLYREVAVVVARQNGKTQLLIPLIVSRLVAGQRIMHTAQDRTLPREVFDMVEDAMMAHYFAELKGKIRRANGQEAIKTRAGGSYRIVAPTRGGARGPTNDLVIIDELREMTDFDFIAAAKPTLTVSKKPQMLYLSNAGKDDSVVLNGLRSRAEADPSLAYLEWSAAEGRSPDDQAGWREANPAIGYECGNMGSVLETLVSEYRSAVLEGTMANFETEHLCRAVPSMREKLVDDALFRTGKVASIGRPSRPVLAVSMDPEGRRASIAQAWKDGEYVNLRLLYDVTGSPIDTDRLGADLKEAAASAEVGFDPYTDAELIKHVRRSKSINGLAYANASAQFVNLVTRGMVRWVDAEPVANDLALTARKPTGEGSYLAVRMKDDVPITAALAAIRAVYLASGPQTATPRVM